MPKRKNIRQKPKMMKFLDQKEKIKSKIVINKKMKIIDPGIKKKELTKIPKIKAKEKVKRIFEGVIFKPISLGKHQRGVKLIFELPTKILWDKV